MILLNPKSWQVIPKLKKFIEMQSENTAAQTVHSNFCMLKFGKSESNLTQSHLFSFTNRVQEDCYWNVFQTRERCTSTIIKFENLEHIIHLHLKMDRTLEHLFLPAKTFCFCRHTVQLYTFTIVVEKAVEQNTPFFVFVKVCFYKNVTCYTFPFCCISTGASGNACSKCLGRNPRSANGFLQYQQFEAAEE